MENSTQEKLILCHLLEGKTISSLEALALYDCMRLASRISDLKKKGWPIRSDMCGHGRNKYKTYWINQEDIERLRKEESERN